MEIGAHMNERLTAEEWHVLGTVTPKEVLWDWQNERVEFLKDIKRLEAQVEELQADIDASNRMDR